MTRRLTKVLIFAVGVLLTPAVSAEPARVKPEQPSLQLQCLPLELSSDCGCGLRVLAEACYPPAHQGGGRAHFFSELYQGAPLQIRFRGRQLSLPSLGPVDKSTFYQAEGDHWQERYAGSGLTVHVNYSPGQSSCPPEKEDGCEYFDVVADVEITVEGESPQAYEATGACGC